MRITSRSIDPWNILASCHACLSNIYEIIIRKKQTLRYCLKLWCNFASIFKFHNPKNVNLLAAVKNWNLTCHSHSCQLTINKGTTKDAAKNVFMCKFWTGLQEHCTYFHTNYFADTTFSHVVTYIAPTVKHFEFYIHKILLEMFSLEARSKDLP